MSTAYVNVPFAGYITVAVDDVTEGNDKEAIDKALEVAGEISVGSDEFKSCCGEFDYHRQLVKGNYCFVNKYEAEVEDWENDSEEDFPDTQRSPNELKEDFEDNCELW